jgi:hypothetical protein
LAKGSRFIAKLMISFASEQKNEATDRAESDITLPKRIKRLRKAALT